LLSNIAKINPNYPRGLMNLNYSFEKFENFIDDPTNFGVNFDLKTKGLINPIPLL